jgi:hypothetical protein
LVFLGPNVLHLCDQCLTGAGFFRIRDVNEQRLVGRASKGTENVEKVLSAGRARRNDAFGELQVLSKCIDLRHKVKSAALPPDYHVLKIQDWVSYYLFLSATNRAFLPLGTTQVDQLLPRRIVRLLCQIIVGAGQFTTKDGLLSTMSADRTATLFVYLGFAFRADQCRLQGKGAQPDKGRHPTQLPHIVRIAAGSQALSCGGIEISLFSAVAIVSRSMAMH